MNWYPTAPGSFLIFRGYARLLPVLTVALILWLAFRGGTEKPKLINYDPGPIMCENMMTAADSMSSKSTLRIVNITDNPVFLAIATAAPTPKCDMRFGVISARFSRESAEAMATAIAELPKVTK